MSLQPFENDCDGSEFGSRLELAKHNFNKENIIKQP